MRQPFLFDPHHDAVERRVAEHGRAVVEPLEAQWLEEDRRVEPPGVGWAEEEDHRARALMAGLKASGLLAFAVSLDGALDGRAVCLCREGLAYHSGLADFVYAMQGLGSFPIVVAGSDALKARYLGAVAEGEAVAAFAITEAEAGSDVMAMSTTATKVGDHYELSGEKVYISNAGLADFYTVFARTGEGRGGVSAFVVPADAPGFSVARRQRVMSPHPIGVLRFEGCAIPLGNRLGAEGDGFKVAMATLDRFRPSVGAAALGLGRRALDEATAHATGRVQFGRPLSKNQAIQFKLGEMDMRLEAARLLVYQAAWMRDQGLPVTREAAMGKLFATEAATFAIDEAVQIHGGRGVLMGEVVERLYRDIRPLRIYEGASEIQRLIIAKQHLGRA